MALGVVPEAARIPVAELTDLLALHQANAYSIISRAGSEIATAAFVGAMHLFNHSCAPSVAFDCVPVHASGSGRGASKIQFALVSLRDIEPGEECCLSYTSTADDRSQRRELLYSVYGFHCLCTRCEQCTSPTGDHEIATRYAAIRCVLRDCGTGYAVAGRCLHCGRPQPDAQSLPPPGGGATEH